MENQRILSGSLGKVRDLRECMATPTPPVNKQGQISSELDRLDSLTNRLNEVVGELYGRLEPVFLSSPQDCEKGCAPDRCLCNVAQVISSMCNRIEDQISALRNLKEGIQI